MMPDQGDVHFAVDLSTGLVSVTVRPPLVLANSAVSAKVSVLTFLDFAAQLTLKLNELQRDAMVSLGRGEIPIAKRRVPE